MVEEKQDWVSSINPDDPDYPNIIVSNFGPLDDEEEGKAQRSVPGWPEGVALPTLEEVEEVIRKNKDKESQERIGGVVVKNEPFRKQESVMDTVIDI